MSENRFFRTTTLFVLAIAAFWRFQTAPVTSAPAGLVAAYGFDEGSGTQVQDASGSGNVGTLSGATWTTSGKFGNALSFDGINDWVTVNDSSSLDLTNGMTLEAWVRPAVRTAWNTVIFKEMPGDHAYVLYATDYGDVPIVGIRQAGTIHAAGGNAPTPVSTWTHLAATYDGASLRLYQNGALVRTTAVSGPIDISQGPLRIGGNGIWSEWFGGLIDEVRIYNRALTATEIQGDMNTAVAALGSDTTPPVIADVTVSAITETSATISWTTNEPADTQVEYGLTTTYGTLTPLDASLVISHAVTLSGLTAGTVYHYRVISKDAAQNVAVSADATFTTSAAGSPPVLVITQPANNGSIAGTTVDVSYTTTGSLTEVNHVHFTLDANPEVMDMSFDGVYQFSNVPAGSHVLNGYLARADHSKISGSDASPVSFTTSVADTVLPTVSITNPVSGASVTGTVAVTADASDNVGVAGVQFLLDGTALGAEDTTSPYSVDWNTATAAQGSHTLTARVRDVNANQATSDPVTVSVGSATDPSLVGQWSSRLDWPLVTVHASVLPNGSILVWDGWEHQALARVWNPANQTFTDVPNVSGIFCSGHSFMADGRLLVSGGHAGGEIGIKDTYIFDFTANTWTRAPDMHFDRWYPTTLTLTDGRVLSFSGQITPKVFADTPEIYNPVTGLWSTLAVNTSTLRDSEYPQLFLLPNGKIYAIGPTPGVVGTLDVALPSWTDNGTIPIRGGSGVMYRPGQILYTGGGNGSTETASQGDAWGVDASQTPPEWRAVAPMQFGRYQHNLVLLPDGNVFAVGGSSIMSLTAGPGVLQPEIWNPATNTWTTMAAMSDPRMYHSSAVLLPDGRVLVAGGGRLGGAADYFSAEIYSPPYLFKGARPSITNAPQTLDYGSTITIQTPNAADIATVALMRLGSTTHTFDMNQSYVPVTFTAGTGELTVQIPSSRNIAPPGHYMVFIVNSQGVPSIGHMARFPSPGEDSVPPTAPSGLTASGSEGAATLTWSAAGDNTGVVAYNVHRSTTGGFAPSVTNRVAQTPATSYTDTGLASGTYYYQVTAQDAAGNIGPPSNEASVFVLPDSTPPVVAITAPTSGSTVSGITTVTADASDNVRVAGVQFLLDGAALGAEDTSAPYSIEWDTRTASSGAHTLSARARDYDGNIGSTASATDVTVSNTSAQQGLVAAYSFNEGTGTTVADASGTGNTGTISGATWTASGKFGGALSFDGVDDWVTVNDAPVLDLTTGMTIEAWVTSTALNGWETVIFKEMPGDHAYVLYAAGDSTVPIAGIRRNGTIHAVSATSAMPVGTWVHLAVTYDGANLGLYVNGTLVRTTAVTGPIDVTQGPLRLGGNSVWAEWFNGLIDEVRIYNRALTAAEIQSDMQTPIN